MAAGKDYVKRGIAELKKGGVIMEVRSAEQAKIAEEAGAVGVMVYERTSFDNGTSDEIVRMADPFIIEEIRKAVSIPVMAKVRIGHIVEARVLETLGVDFIDESEVLGPADEEYHINKKDFAVPFVCGCCDLGEAARRIGEGASMLRTKREGGRTENIAEAVRHIRKVNAQVRKIVHMEEDEIMKEAEDIRAPYEILLEIKRLGRLPVVNFAAGGVATPSDAALMMELGADGIFVDSCIFKSENAEKMVRAIVEATADYKNYQLIAELSKELGTPTKGIEFDSLIPEVHIQERGW